MSKTAEARRLFAAGATSSQVAHLVGITANRACVIRWQMARPGYKAEWMRKKRATDPQYYSRELIQQTQSRRIKGGAHV